MVKLAVSEAVNMTDIFKIALGIHSREEAERFLEEYTNKILEESVVDVPWMTKEDAKTKARENLACFAGFYSEEVREHVEEMFGAIHPTMGSIKEPTLPPAGLMVRQEHHRNRAR